jgi:hypothetical protein
MASASSGAQGSTSTLSRAACREPERRHRIGHRHAVGRRVGDQSAPRLLVGDWMIASATIKRAIRHRFGH